MSSKCHRIQWLRTGYGDSAVYDLSVRLMADDSMVPLYLGGWDPAVVGLTSDAYDAVARIFLVDGIESVVIESFNMVIVCRQGSDLPSINRAVLGILKEYLFDESCEVEIDPSV